MFGLRIRQNYWTEQTFSDHSDFPNKVCDLLHQKSFVLSSLILFPSYAHHFSPPLCSTNYVTKGVLTQINCEGGGRRREMWLFGGSLDEPAWSRRPFQRTVKAKEVPRLACCWFMLLVYNKSPWPSCHCFGLSFFYVVFISGSRKHDWSCSKICLELLKSMDSVLSSAEY